MQLTDETPAVEMLDWMDEKKVTHRVFRGGDMCPCCGDGVPPGRLMVVLYDARGPRRKTVWPGEPVPLIVSGGCGPTIVEAYAAAVERYEDVLRSDS